MPSTTIPSLSTLTPATLPEIIGREREWTRLLEAAGRLVDGEGCVVHLVGERGLGKTLLKDSLVAELRRRAVVVRELRSTPAGPPLGVLDELLAPAVEAEGLAGLAASLDWSPREREQIDTLLRNDDDDAVDKTALRSALVSLLIRGDGPRALVFEDFSHASPLVREVVEHAAIESRSLPMLLVVVERPGAAVATRRPGWHVLRLAPLPPEASRALVQSRLDVRQLPEATVRQLVDKVAGNPYFLDQILEAWVEDGVLAPAGSGFIVQRTDKALRLPESLDAALEERIARLPETQRDLLRLVAVAGSTSSGVLTAAASEVLECPTSGIRTALKSLSSHRLVERVSGAIDVSESVLADIAARGLDEAQRSSTHAALARALEANGSPNAERLAYHWVEAGCPERALPFLVSAAKDRRRVFDHDGAETLYRRAIDIVRSGSSTGLELHPELWEELGDVYRSRGDYRSAADAYAAAEEQSLDYTDPGAMTAARRLRKQALIAVHLGEPANALQLVASARAACARPHLGEAAWVCTVEATALLRRSQLGDARRVLVEGLELARSEPSDGLRSEVLAHHASVAGRWYLRRARPDEALVVIADGLRHAERVDNHGAISDLLRNQGRALLQLGRLDAARHYLMRSQEAATRADDLAGQARARGALAELGLAAGDADTAMAEAMGGMALAGAVEDPVLTAELTLGFARVEFEGGLLEPAEDELDNGASLAAAACAPLLELEAQLLAAEIAVARSRPTLARPAVDGVLARAEQLGELELIGRARLLLADILAQRNHREEALTVLLDVLHRLSPARRLLRTRALDAVRRLGRSANHAAEPQRR